MGRFQFGLVGALALTSALSFTQEAEAAPVASGTFVVAAERLASSNLWVNNGVSWNNQILGAPGLVPFETPRLGLDYFVIDGLSIGGHVGFGFAAWDGGGTSSYIAVLPRVGYAFSLTDKIDFWPRAGAGIIAGDGFLGQGDSGVITLEAMFLAELLPHISIEFGPATDIPLGGFWPDAIIGANAGLALTF